MQVVKASIRWTAKGKPEFEAESQLLLDLTESTANLENILSSVRDQWGSRYILVTNDGIQIEETSGSIGTLTVLVLMMNQFGIHLIQGLLFGRVQEEKYLRSNNPEASGNVFHPMHLKMLILVRI